MDSSSSISDANAPVEFYLPATFQFRDAPGRIERFLGRAFGRHHEESPPAVESTGREFYLPGTPDVSPVDGR